MAHLLIVFYILEEEKGRIIPLEGIEFGKSGIVGPMSKLYHRLLYE